MKKTILIVIIIVLAAGGVLLYMSTRPDYLEEARRAENQGLAKQALQQYTDALIAFAERNEFPDKNDAKLLSADEYRRKVADFLHWFGHPPQEPHPDIAKAVAGILRCTAGVEMENFTGQYKSAPAAQDTFAGVWNSTFFPNAPNLTRNHQPLIAKALGDNLSLVTFRAGYNYSYEMRWFSRSSTKLVEDMLYSENSVTFPSSPGEYLLLCKSTVTFKSGQIWTSPWSVLAFATPPQPHLISYRMKTKVSRHN
ncbi:MAG: hypothetical protein GF398_01160 [Chitinivibrionales bacterium]|nr:hypothetical protein [Chitinivibrionales bacterium]